MNICTLCQKEYTYKRSCSSKSRCGSCTANHKRFKLKSKMVAYKGGKCSSCSYKRNLAALTFHHLNPTEKDFDLSGAHCRSWDKIQKELDKCVCLCFNCHAELHYPKAVTVDGAPDTPPSAS